MIFNSDNCHQERFFWTICQENSIMFLWKINVAPGLHKAAFFCLEFEFVRIICIFRIKFIPMHKKKANLSIRICLTLFLLMFLTSGLSAQETSNRKKLVGNWTFYKLEYPKDLSREDKADSAKAARMNAGIMLIFTTDGKYKVSIVKNKQREVVASGIIKLSENDTYLKIEGMEGYIADLDNQYLKLFHPDKPLLVFKKN